LPHASHDADAVEIHRGGLLRLRVPLRYEQHEIVCSPSCLKRSERRGSPDEERHDDVREYYDVAERENGKAVGGDDKLAVDGEGWHFER
jgi:hypothetical protein